MRLQAVLAALPEEYEVVRGRRGVLAVARDARAVLLASGFGPEGGEELSASDLSGRSALGTIDAPGERWLVRRHHHGGFLRSLGQHLFLEPARPFHELVLAHELTALGLRTPRVIAARATRAAPFGWHLALVTRRVEDVVDGAELLERLRQGEPGGEVRRRFFASLGELVARLHRARFLHADLQPRNVLASAEGSVEWILDLDRGRLGTELGELERRDNLRRLYRAVRRREARGRAFLRRSDYLTFLRAYQATRGRGASWSEDWRAIVRRDRARSAFHRLGWFFEERLGAGPEHRDGTARVG